MRVWHTPTWCAAAVAMRYIQQLEQYTYSSKPMRWFGLELR